MRFRQKNRATGGHHRGKLVDVGEIVLSHLLEAKKESGNPAPELVDRWKLAACSSKSGPTDEHLVKTDDGIVCARCARRVNEQRRSQEKLRAVAGTPQKPKSTTLDTPRAVHPAESSAPEGSVKEDTAAEPPRTKTSKCRRCRWTQESLRADTKGVANAEKHMKPLS